MEKMVTRTRLALGAAALLALIVVPVAMAATDSGSQATASAGGKKKIKRLAERVGELEQANASLTQQVAELQGEQGGGRPPTGEAGGDLAGTYPDPSIGTGAVNSAKVADGSLGGIDIDPQTTIALGRFAARSELSAADGLLTGVFTHNAFGTAVDFGGVEVFENTLSDNLSASLSPSELSFRNALFSSRVTFGDDPAPLAAGETRYERTITLPETDPFDPGNPPGNSVRIYVDDFAGSTQLLARFADGEIVVLAEEGP
jgi:hypothetical protein